MLQCVCCGCLIGQRLLLLDVRCDWCYCWCWLLLLWRVGVVAGCYLRRCCVPFWCMLLTVDVAVVRCLVLLLRVVDVVFVVCNCLLFGVVGCCR